MSDFLYINGKIKRSPNQSDQFIAYSYNIDYQNQNYNVHNMQEAIDKLFSEIDILKNSSPVIPPTPQNLTIQINPNYQTTIPHPSTTPNNISYISIGISAKNSNNEEVQGSLSSISPTSGTGWNAVANGKTLTIYNNNDATVTEPRIISKDSIQGTFTPRDTTLYNTVTNIKLPPADITLNPAPQETTYTLSFDVRGGSNPIESSTFTYGYTYILPYYTGTKSGYSHQNVWTYIGVDNNTPTTIDFGSSWNVEGDKEFYIDWKENQDECTLTIVDATIYQIIDSNNNIIPINSNSNNVWRPDLSNSQITLSDLQGAVETQGTSYYSDHRTTMVTLNKGSQYTLQLLAPPQYQFDTAVPIISNNNDYIPYISYVGNQPVTKYLTYATAYSYSDSYSNINSELNEKTFINEINSSIINESAADNTVQIEMYLLDITTKNESGSFTLTPNFKLIETVTNYYWYVGHETESNAMNSEYLANLVNGKNSTTSTTGPSTLTIPTTTGEILLYIYPTIWGTPTIVDSTGYGTGDDTFENAGLTSPEGYHVIYWTPGGVEGKTLNITWTK